MAYESPSQKFAFYDPGNDKKSSKSSSETDSEEMMFDKLECAEMFRDEVRKWLKEYGAGILKSEPFPAPQIVQTPYKKPWTKKTGTTYFTAHK